MAPYQPEVIPGTPQGQALQAAIQKQLAFHGWSTEDDTVMAEYCLVMLGNRKTAEQISTELSDLIGGDFDPSFTTWLFKELAVHYPDPSLPSSQPAASASTSTESPSGPRNLAIAGGAGGRQGQNGRGAGGVFGQAMSGVKRDSRELGGEPERQRAKYERPSQFDGVPSGPRNGGDRRGGGGRGRNNGQGGNIFDRVGAGNQANGNFDSVQNTIDLVTRGANPGNLSNPFNNNNNFSPQMMAQAQAQAMAFAALAQQWGAANGQMQQGFNPAFGMMNQQGPPGQGFGMQGMGGHQGGPGGHRGGRGGFGGRGGHHNPPPPPPAPAAAPLPTKPLQEAICKHATECTKPSCPFSHPSPKATKESGLVLSSEHCEKGLNCEDPDCPKSHVSPSQKNAPAASATPTPAPAPAPPVDPNTIPGAGEKMCKFAGACTRPGCVFLHPWDQREGGGTVNCRWGEQCTRADCHFAHPPNRINVYLAAKAAKKGGGAGGANKYSAVFNKPTPAASGIGAWPSEDKDHVSDRLKRFNNGEEGGEKIIPGAAANAGKEEGQGDKVEIVLEEEKKE